MPDIENLEECIIEIYRCHYVDVYRFLICFTGNENDAEDLTQEVFIRVLKNISNYQTGILKTWIFSIAKHVAIDHYRKKDLFLFLKKAFLNSWPLMKRNQLT